MKSVYGSFLKTLFGALMLGLFLVGTATESQAQCLIDPVADSTYYPPFPPATCDALVSWDEPTFGGPGCAGGEVLTQVLGPANGSIFAVGTYLIRYELRDGVGTLLDTEEWTITVADTVNPVITGCPADITVDQDSGECGAIVTWVAPNASDACGISSFTSNYNSGDLIPVGVNEIVYVATDPSGNTDTCSFFITVNDTSAPVIACPSDTTFLLSALGGACPPALTLDTLVWDDFCPPTITYSGGARYSFGQTNNGGQCDPTYTATVFNLPASWYNNWNGDGNINFELIAGTGINNFCGFNDGYIELSGPVTATSLVTPLAFTGGSAQIDVPVPTTPVAGPVTVTVYVRGDINGSTERHSVFGEPIVSGTGADPSDVYPVGTTTVTFSVDDGTFVSTCSFDVTVIDDIAPSIDCSGIVTTTVNNDPGVCTGTVSGTVSASDNCSYTITNDWNGQTSTDGPLAFSATDMPVGSTTVTFTVTDEGLNTATCSIVFTVNDVEAPVIDCSDAASPISVGTDGPTDCFATISFQVDATDNCEYTINNDYNAQSSTNGTLNFSDQFAPGSYTVVFTATDPAGNSVTCNVDITVVDDDAPVLTCADQTFNNDPNQCDAVVNYSLPTALDNCDGDVSGSVVLVSGPAPGSTFPVGTTPVEYSVTDAAGNTATCTFLITVDDNENPVITSCASNTTVALDAACSATVPDLTASTSFTDNCPGATISQSPAAGTPVNGEQTVTVTITVTDASANSVQCTADVFFEDQTAPTINTCPADVASLATSTTTTGDCVADYTASIDVSDNCSFDVDYEAVNVDGTTLTGSIAVSASSGVFNFTINGLPLGDNTITYTVTDEGGNTDVCSNTVTVEDDESPVITCPGAIVQDNDPDTCGAQIQITVSATDNCAYTITNDYDVTQSSNNGDLILDAFFPVSLTPITVTFTVTDTAGNTDVCTVDVTISDTSAPVLVCPLDIEQTVLNDTVCYDVIGWSDPIPDDNCALASITQTSGFSNPGLYAVGNYTVTYESADIYGNSSTCEFRIEVIDDVDPQIQNCPTDQTIPYNPATCGAIANWTPPTAIDNCVGVTLTSNYAPGSVFPVGTTDVIYIATDPSGNIDSCVFTITVEDLTPPVIACQGDTTVPNDPGECGAIVTYQDVTYIEDCDTIGVTYDGFQGPFDPSNWVLDVDSDSTGGIDLSATPQTVTIIGPDNGYAPTTVNNCSSAGYTDLSIVIPADGEYRFGWNYFTTDGDFRTAYVGTYDPANDPFAYGVNGVYTQLTDDLGDPTQSGFETLTLSQGDVLAFRVNTTDQCGGGATVNLTISGTIVEPTTQLVQTAGLPNGSFFPVGSTLNRWEVTDVTGNTDFCEFIVTVDDVEAPIVNCPAPVAVNNDLGVCGATITIPAMTDMSGMNPAPGSVYATDNCGIASIVNDYTGTADASGFYPVGTTTVTFTVTDIYSNVSTCSFDVVVTDNEAPTAICQNVNVFLDAAGTASITPADIDNGSSDNCGIASLVLSQTDFTCADVGVNTVTLLVTDVNGNTATCSADVSVFDNIPPTALCQNITVELDATGNATITTADIDNGSFDNCGIDSLSLSQTAFDCNDLGPNVVTLTVTDVNGNVSQCTAIVTVEDNIAPTALCQDITVYLDDDGDASITPADIDNGSFDNCTIVSTTLDVTAFDCSNVGANTVVLTVEDQSGNIGTCSAVVTVLDTTRPEIICPPDLIANNAFGLCGNAIQGFQLTFLDDNCGIDTVYNSWTENGANANAFYPVGTTTVVFTAIDVNGNVATCSADVTIIDFERPTLICPADIVVNNDPGVCGAAVTWTIDYFENCPNDTLYRIDPDTSLMSGDVFPVGTTTISYFAEDESGNTSTCSFTITVIDNEAPVFANCSADITVPNGIGLCGAQVFYPTPTESDNCPGLTTTFTGLGSGAIFPVGTTTETYIATDASGNTAICEFTVTVEDVEDPVITCPADITVSTDPGVCEAVVTVPLPDYTDNCEVITTTPGATPAPTGDATIEVFIRGDYSFSLEYADLIGENGGFIGRTFGNGDCRNDYASASYNVQQSTVASWAADGTITLTIDNSSFVNSFCSNGDNYLSISYPYAGGTYTFTTAPQSINFTGQNFTFNITGFQSSNLTANVVNDFNGGLDASGTYPLGTTPVTYVVTDPSGNTDTCTFNVTVVDTEAPMVMCNNDTTITTSSDGTGDCTAAYTVDYTTSDNCSNDVLFVDVTVENGGTVVFNTLDTVMAGSYSETYDLPLGLNVITVSVTDTNGVTGTCVTEVDVIDDELPTITCPASITVSNDPGVCEAFVTVPAPVATDNCSVTFTNDYNGTADASDVYPVGTTIVVFTAEDGSGNSAQCAMQITVEDTEAPVYTSCPTDTILSSDTGLCGAIFIFDLPTFTDNCPGATQSLTNGLPSLSIFPVGTTTVEYTATDAAGNTAICSFDVTVNDVEAPQAVLCPGDQVIASEPGVCGATATWLAPFFIDNCGVDSTASNFVPGDFFPVGTTTVTYVAFDAAGNTAECSFDITVEDVEDPVFTACPTDIFSCDPVQTWTFPTATDNCAIDTIIGTAASGDVFPVGTTTVVYTATDVNGNTATCSFTVTIYPTPVVDAGADVDVCLNSSVTIGGNPTASAATAPYNYTWSPAAGLDDPTIANPSASPSATTVYTVVVTDANGCTAEDEVEVTVLPLPTADAGADQAICFGDATTIGGSPAASGTVAPYTYSWTPAGSLSSANAANPTATPTATTTYTLTVTDANGCQSDDVVTITVNPLPDATITAAGPFCLNDGNQTLTAATAGGTWSGNGIVDAAAGTFNPATAGVGVHMITYNVTDANGCSNSATTTIEVLPLPNSRILPAGPLCENDDPIFLTGLPNITPSSWQGTGIVNSTTGQFDPGVAGAGNHVVEYIVTNAVGCTDTASIVITVNAAPAVVATPAGPFCETEPVQTLTANIAGGVWSGPGIIQPQLGQFLPIAASAGTHEVVYEVADNNGCEGADTLTVVVFEVPAITASVDEASCEDASDGAIDINVSGGTAPYTYSWSNGATTEDLNGVAAGTYTVVVTDANGCTQDASITIGVSVNPVSVAATITPATNAAIADGAIDITVTGGVPPYTFAWSNGATTEDLSGIAPGTYELTIIDDAGCSYVFFYQVAARFGVGIDLADLDQNINLYPNPTSDVINVDIEVGTVNAEMTMTVFDMLGRRVYEVNDAFTGAYQHRIEMTTWAAGQYMVRFNINGQQLTKKFILAR